MKTYKYKTLKGLIQQTPNGIVTLDDVLSKHILLNGRGYCPFELSFEAKKEFAKLCAKELGGRRDTRERIERIITFGYVKETFGIYRRMWVIIGYKGAIVGDYCAGQDYVSECAYVRRLLLTK